jgi:hypothetical protein
MALSFLKERNQINLELKLLLELQKKYKLEYTFFSNFFKPILNLEKNDKIGIENIKDININYKKIDFTLYLDKYNMYQSISRWYYKQERSEIFKKLDQLFEEYQTFLKECSKLDNYYIKDNIMELNKLLKKKLELLKETYNDNIISEKINNYLQILSCQ